MPSWLLYTLVTLLAYVGMEFMAWFSHKYIMHGFLWKWHEDHHLPKHQKHGFFEKNDRFFLVFAIPSAFSYMFGSMTPHFWVFFIGVGISLYGLTYFLIHDVYIHQRFPGFGSWTVGTPGAFCVPMAPTMPIPEKTAVNRSDCWLCVQNILKNGNHKKNNQIQLIDC